MKKQIYSIIAVVALCGMLFTGCKKDPMEREGGITLNATLERVGGPDSKIYIGANDIPRFFASGDTVNVNGEEYSIVGSSDRYAIPHVTEQEDGKYYAFYPASMLVLNENPTRENTYTVGDDGSVSCTVKFPRVQHYVEQDDHQKLNLPVGAILVPAPAVTDDEEESKDGNILRFYNLCSLIEVQYGGTNTVSSIEVTAKDKDIWGEGVATINATSSRLTINSTETSDDNVESHSRVVLFVPDGTTANTFYVMVPPYDGNTEFTVKIRFADGNSSITKTKSSVTLGRNVIVSLVTSEDPHIDNELTGYYSIRPDLKVVFSRGNLQHRGDPNNVNTGTWYFADRQYDYYGLNNQGSNPYGYEGVNSLSQKVDLFSLSISGETPSTNSNGGALANPSYGVRSPENLDNYSYYTGPNIGFKDWGELVISGDPANTWFTLTNSEWQYLLNTRTNAVNLRANVKITSISDHPGRTNDGGAITTVYGYVFFPDDFDPADIPSGVPVATGTTALYTITAAQFAKLEAVGAMFLPAAGYRSAERSWIDYVTSENTGYHVGHYWTATSDYETKENRARVYQANVSNYEQSVSEQLGEWFVGKSVRLAKPAPGYTYSQAQSTDDLPDLPSSGATAYRIGPSSK